MKNILEYKRALTIFGATMTAISGACWGYVYASAEVEKEFDAKMNSTLDAEIDRVRRFYATRYKDFGPEEVSELSDADVQGGVDSVVSSGKQFVIPAEALTTPEGKAAVMDAVKELVDPTPEEEPLVEVHHAGATVHYDEALLRSNRDPSKPYIISREEFTERPDAYEEYKLTFFEKDGVLMGEDEMVIPDADNVVGDANLQFFGAMSGRNDLLYVQNDASYCVFIITKSSGSAEEFIYGGDDADPDVVIAHSSMKRRRPRRDSDN